MNSEKSKKKIEPNKELIDCLKEKEDYLKGWQRERADFINYKKSELDRVEKISYQNDKKILFELLAVLDNLERFQKEARMRYGEDSFYEGSLKIQKEFMHILEKSGVERMVVEQEQFDPKKHEAIETIQLDGRKEGEIIEEVLPGYWFRGEVLRPAKVKVAGPQNN
jgi:molecular chaperone GrpE